MHSGSHSFARRLAALEQRRERVQTMRIVFGGRYAAEHVGVVRVKAGAGRIRYEIRTPGEAWNDFATRMDIHATGVLRLIQFQPVDSEGNDLLYDETPEELLQ